MTRRAVLFTLFVLLPGIAIAQQGAASPIDGVWRVAEIVVTGPNASTVAKPQPSQIMFARGYYSWMHIGGETPRKPRANPGPQGKLTDAQKIAAFDEWAPFTANSGSFDVKGNTLSRRRFVAKNGFAMGSAPPLLEQFKLEGETLWITTEPDAAGATTRYKLTRVR